MKLDNRLGHWFLRIGFLAMLVFGSVASLPEVIALADLSTGLMTILNVSALFLLTKVIVSVVKNYNNQHSLGQLPEYKPNQQEHNQFHLTKGVWQDN